MQPIATHFVMECPDADSKRLGGLLAVEIARLEHRLDRRFFTLFDSFRKRPSESGRRPRIGSNFGGKLGSLDGFFGNGDHHPFHHISQLAYIAWPIGGHQGLHRLFC